MSRPGAGRSASGVPYFLPRGYVPITLSGTPIRPAKPNDPMPFPSYQVSAAVSPTAYIGDRSTPLFLAYQHQRNAEDHFAIHVDSNGLLQTVSTISTDQTPQIALKVAELVGQIAATAIGGLPSVGRIRTLSNRPTGEAQSECSLPPFSNSVAFFPDEGFNSFEIKGKGKQAVTVSINIVSDGRQTDQTNVGGLHDPSKEEDGKPVSKTGIAFRHAKIVQYQIIFNPTQDAITACGFGRHSQNYLVTIPDEAPANVFYQDMSRGTFVTKKVSLSISNGMLTGVEIDNPSETLAIVSLPLDLLKVIVSIPAAALAIRVQNYAAEQSLNDAQTKLLQSQVSLLQAQAAAQQAQASSQAQPQ